MNIHNYDLAKLNENELQQLRDLLTKAKGDASKKKTGGVIMNIDDIILYCFDNYINDVLDNQEEIKKEPARVRMCFTLLKGIIRLQNLAKATPEIREEFENSIQDILNSVDNDNDNVPRKSFLETIDELIDTEIKNASPEIKNEVKQVMQEAKAIAYGFIRQGTATNKPTKINVRKKDKPKPDPITNTLKVTRDDFTVTIEKYIKNTELKTSTWQLFDALTQELTYNGVKSPIVKLSLEEYMNMRGLKSEDRARKQIKEDLAILSHVRFAFKQMCKGKEAKNFLELAIIGTYGIRNGVIEVAFDTVFTELYKEYSIMPYPMQLYRINSNDHPHSYYFLRKIAEHKNMNYDKPNADIIAVSTLLEASPDMPTYEEVSQSDRHYDTRIIEPFERDMDALDETLTWHYCHSNNTPLTDDELPVTDYNVFIKLLVKITWRDYPVRDIQPKPRKKRTAKSNPPIAL